MKIFDPPQRSFPVSRLFASGDQNIGASASGSVLPMNIQGWFPLGLTGLISLQSKGLSRLTLQCSAFFMVQLSHPYMTTGKTIALTRWTFVGKGVSHLRLGEKDTAAGISLCISRSFLTLGGRKLCWEQPCEEAHGVALQSSANATRGRFRARLAVSVTGAGTIALPDSLTEIPWENLSQNQQLNCSQIPDPEALR